MVQLVFIELFLSLYILVSVMLTLFADWSWIPISSIDRDRGHVLKDIKKHLLE